MSYWEIGRYVDEKWEFEGKFDDPQLAIITFAFESGRPTLAKQDENGTFAVKDLETGEIVGCVRHVEDAKETKPGMVPSGRPGPLKRWRGLTWVGWLNYLVLRWFLFRIYYMVEEDNTISRYGVRFVPTWRWSR